MRFSCENKIYTLENISISSYKRYLKLKKFHKSKGEYEEKYAIINFFFNIKRSTLEKYDISEIYFLYYCIELFIKETINDKFIELADVEETKESVFDEFVEDEVNDNNKDIIEYYDELANYYIKYSIVNLNMSYKECMDSIFTDLLDFIKFDKKINPQQKQENEDDVY